MFPTLSIGPISLPFPPLILVVGLWLGISIAEKKSKLYDIDPALIDKLLGATLVSGLIGARLSFIFRNIQAFKGNILSMVSINPNLLDSTGGLFVAIAVGFFIISNSKINPWKILDLLSLFFIILLISVGLSNFAAGDGFGTSTTLPWGIKLWGENRHPVQLYYVLADIIVLAVVLKYFASKLSTPGNIFTLFSILTTSAYLFLSGFQETQTYIIYGLHQNKITLWLLLLISLSLSLIRYSSVAPEAN